MSYFVVEHKYKGRPVIETITGVEDIDMSQFPEFKTLFICKDAKEAGIVESELRRKYG